MSQEVDYQLTCMKLQRHLLPMGALGLALHPDGERAYVACMDGVYELNLSCGERARLYQHRSYASGVVCIHEREMIVSAGYDGVLQWYDLAWGEIVQQVQAHSFWSWDLARAAEVPTIASCSGQYLAGSYRYEPRPASEPCVRVYDGSNGQLIDSLEHMPPVQSVALSSDGQLVAAGNLMGDAAVWQLGKGRVADWNTPDFTGFGIIKSHCHVGGLYATAFVPGSTDVVVAGMGPMRDPMAGNGKQRWQRFDWCGELPTQVAASVDDQVGEGLMETLAFHPEQDFFVMAGRLRGGSWNTGIFDLPSGNLVHSFKTDTRVTKAQFSADGSRLLLAGADKQAGKAEKEFGVVDVYSVHVEPIEDG